MQNTQEIRRAQETEKRSVALKKHANVRSAHPPVNLTAASSTI
jgi:hypothetical protein